MTTAETLAAPGAVPRGLACPRCRAPLEISDRELKCRRCAGVYEYGGGAFRFTRDGAAAPEGSYREELLDHVGRVEGRHFWYLGRREIIHQALAKALPDRKSRFLEIGFGNATVLEYLKARGIAAEGLDGAEAAVAMAAERGLGPVYAADGRRAPFVDGQFDGIGLFDVLEHLDDEDAMLSEARRLLAPAGKLVLTVPADPRLWSRFDEAYGHRKRYRKEDLRDAVERNGFALEWTSHFVFFLYPVLRVVRRLESRNTASNDFLGAVRFELDPPAPLNAAALAVLRMERRLLSWVQLPFGASLIAVARRC